MKMPCFSIDLAKKSRRVVAAERDGVMEGVTWYCFVFKVERPRPV